VWFTLGRADVEGAGRDVTYTVRQRVEAGERWAYWASVTQLLRDLRAGAAAINAAVELRFDDVDLGLACEIRFGAGGAPGNPCAAGWRLEQFLLALERWARGAAIDARATARDDERGRYWYGELDGPVRHYDEEGAPASSAS
jgi:hypothetical protein